MSVSNQGSYIAYVGNGVSVAYAFPYYFRNTTDLVVTLRDGSGNVTTQRLVTDYAVTGVLDPDLNVYVTGGTVTFTTPPAAGLTVLINRLSPLTQTAVYNPQDPFPAKSHEAALDALELQQQDLQQHYKGYTDGIPSRGTYAVDDWFYIRNAASFGFKEIICTIGGGPGVFVFKPANPISA